MHSDKTSNGAPTSDQTPGGLRSPDDLPAVEPPSAGFILQLFLVPGILVTVLVAFIWFFFGGPGGGPQSADDFIEALRSANDKYRWKTAEHLAQVLQRDDNLARNVKLALAITELLEQELKNPPPIVSASEPEREEAPDTARFLAAAAGRFQVPLALPLLQRMIDQNERTDDVGRRLRLRAALWAVALLGESLNDYDAVPDEKKEELGAALVNEAKASTTTARAVWAQRAFDHLVYRQRRRTDQSAAGKEPFGVIDSLAKGARSDDEMCRKYTILALTQWDDAGSDRLLQELAGGNTELRHFENSDERRGRREIRYNAALALARRASPHTPLELVLETLNEAKQRELHPDNPGMADQTLVIALRAMQELKRRDAAAFAGETALVSAVETLAHSSNPRLQVEARKLLTGGTAVASGSAAGLSRQTLLMLGVGGGVLLLLGVAVFARWRRNTAAAFESKTPGGTP